MVQMVTPIPFALNLPQRQKGHLSACNAQAGKALPIPFILCVFGVAQLVARPRRGEVSSPSCRSDFPVAIMEEK